MSADPATPPVLAFGVEPSDRRFRLRLARYPALADAIGAFVGRRDTAVATRLLDIGCGRGRTLRYVEALPGGIAERVEWVGVDLDPRLPERLHHRARWHAALADISHGLPFRDAAFDVVVCEQVIEHLDDPAAALSEMARVLRPGGLLVVGVPTFPPGVAALRDLAASVVSRDDAKHGHGHVQTFSAVSFRRLVERTGAFEIERLRGFRSASGGVLAPLEDRRWWWRLNGVMLGAFPWFAAEVQVVARRLP
ncbi:MAG: class I SAM-dependent methyltransferase [Planctomycetes bacterium]|nr:class I SAM-dependent methyltransferase [Planctomycetota bacterium]